ncbi:MAG: superoxide dismutase family protein [Hyphomicrobium sp.]
MLALTAATAVAATLDVNAISAEGVGKSIGSATFSDADGGLSIKIDVSGMNDGEHGFHVHEKGDCSPGMKDGKMAAGIAAGAHYDPQSTKSHKGPDAGGHEGDLPKLMAAGGKIDQTVMVKDLTLADVAGRSLMIHEGGDNYSDNPENGGGKGRIACGVIPR